MTYLLADSAPVGALSPLASWAMIAMFVIVVAAIVTYLNDRNR